MNSELAVTLGNWHGSDQSADSEVEVARGAATTLPANTDKVPNTPDQAKNRSHRQTPFGGRAHHPWWKALLALGFAIDGPSA